MIFDNIYFNGIRALELIVEIECFALQCRMKTFYWKLSTDAPFEKQL